MLFCRSLAQYWDISRSLAAFQPVAGIDYNISIFEGQIARGCRCCPVFLPGLKKKFLITPEKNWKFSVADIEERQFWTQYMEVYEACLSATSADIAPWHVVPADDKKNARLIISQIILDTFKALKMSYPMVSETRRQELLSIRRKLTEDDPGDD